MPARKSAPGGAQSTAPAMKSTYDGSQNAAPATKDAKARDKGVFRNTYKFKDFLIGIDGHNLSGR